MDPPDTPVVSNPASPGWSRSIERLRAATAGRFTIVRELGRGGFATVFLAQQHQPSRRVAIKLLSPALLDSDWALEHFRGESQKIAEWRHQAVVTIYEVHEEDSLLYFVMSYVEGASLHEILQLLGPLPIPIVRSVLAQVGSALSYAHRQGVTHRDIKPHNILIDTYGGAVVTDFGIAKQADGPSHTATGMIVGTAPYMAPEQCESGRASPASDQYALGIVAYEMLTGATPFSGPATAVLIAHIQHPVPGIRERRPDCPPELEAAVMRMLTKKPTDRFPSVAAAMAALGAVELPEANTDRHELARSARLLAARQRQPVLEVASMPGTIEVGEIISIGARALTPAGEPLPDISLEWSTGPEGLVSIDPTGGTLTGIGVGSTSVMVRGGGVEQRIPLEVSPATAAQVIVKWSDQTLYPGDRVPLTAEVVSRYGAPVQNQVVWWSEHPRLASITPDGELIIHHAGRAHVVATVGAISGELWLDIVPPPVDRVQITGDAAPMLVGDQRQFTATALDARGQPLPDRVVRWASSDREVALVSANGHVSAISPGTVSIQASCEGHDRAVELAIHPQPVAVVEIASPSTTLHAGDSIRLRAIPRAADGRRLARRISWRSDDPAVATVDADGTATAVAAGVTSLTAFCEGVRSSVRIAVVPSAPLLATDPRVPSTADEGASTPPTAAGVTAWMSAGSLEVVRETSGQEPPDVAASGPEAALPEAVVPEIATPETAVATPEATAPEIAVPEATPAGPVATPPVATIPATSPSASPGPPAASPSATTRGAPQPSRRRMAAGAVAALLLAAVATALFLRDSTGNTPDTGLAASDSAAGSSLPSTSPPAAVAGAGGAAPVIDSSPARVALVVSADRSELRVDDSLRLHAQVAGRPAGGVRWRSTSGDVATVTAAGLVRARGTGRVAIIGTLAGAADTVQLSVARRMPTTVEVAEGGEPSSPPSAPPVAAPSQPPAAGYARAGGSGAGGSTRTPVAAPPPAPTTTAPEELRRVVDGYASALRNRSLGDLLRLYPTMAQNEREGWTSLFDFARDLQVTMTVEKLDVGDGTATARVVGEYRFTNPESRRECEQPITLQMRFERGATGWLIAGMDQKQGRSRGC